MKITYFLTLILIVNFMIAVNTNWQIFNKILVIINALAILLLIALQLIPRKADD